MLQEEIVEAPAIEPITEAEIKALLGKDPYICKTDWRGNIIRGTISTLHSYVKEHLIDVNIFFKCFNSD